jgi:hypothetical protein
MFEREFYDESIDKKSKLLIVKDSETEKYFFNFLSKYLSNLVTKRIVGFDIEFNTPPGSHNERVIAIFQMAFYLKGYVLVIFFDPALLNKKTNKLIHQLLINQQILKIGHGTDSLDVPAIYNYLETNEQRIQFTNSLYDTRFLCEYKNIITGEKLCNIYHLLESYSVITPKQFEWLKTNEDKLGDFWRKKIDIKKLSPELRDYSMYDAFYLKRLLALIKKNFKKINLDYSIVIQSTRLVFLLKRGVIKLDDFSNFNIYFLSNKKKLHDYFMEVYSRLNEDIFKIGYFKNQLIKILQLLFYIEISKSNTIYKSSNTSITSTDIKNLESIWNDFSIYLKPYTKINKIINKFLNLIKSKI